MAKTATATPKKTETPSPLKKGVDPRTLPSGNPSAKWLKLEPNSSIDFVCLVEDTEIISCEQVAIWLTDGGSPVWCYTGKDDPLHDLGLSKRYRAFLPVLVKSGGDAFDEVQVWPMGVMAHKAVMEIADAIGSIKGQVLRAKRTGSGLATKYSVINRGKEVDVSDVDEVDIPAMLGPLTTEGVREMIAEKLGCEDYDEVLRKAKGKKITKAFGKRKGEERGKHVHEDDEELSDSDDDDEDDDDVRLM